jgi:DNA-directed RNA polymerase subunit RPC12/RpoP
LVCPNCGGEAQLEAGRSAICPYCGRKVVVGKDGSIR